MKINNKSKSRRNSIILSFTCIVINFVALISSTLAWFASNKEVNANEMNIQIDVGYDVRIVSKTLYGWDYDDNEAEISDEYTLNQYDSFIRENNENARKYLKVNLSYPRTFDPSYTSATLKVMIKIDENKENSFTYVQDDNTYINNYVSNISQYKFYDNSNGKILESSDASEVFESAKLAFNTIEAKTFINEYTSGTYDHVKLGSKDYYKTSVIEAGGFELTMNRETGYLEDSEFYIEYDYNSNLIDLFSQNSEENMNALENLENGISVSFDADIKSIYFEVVYH